MALVGYSMGGNLVLKLAGEWGARPPLAAVATVCPAIDLAAGADALHEPANRVYEWKFLRALMQRFRRKAKLFPEIYTASGIGPVRSIREFDQKIVARYCGFRDADDYYYRAASARVIDRIAVPTLILYACDDPFIRLFPETRARSLPIPTSTLSRPATEATAPFLPGAPPTASTGPRLPWSASFRLSHAGTFGDAAPPTRAQFAAKINDRGRVAQLDRAPAF